MYVLWRPGISHTCSFQVDIPIAQCICKDSQGHNFKTFVSETCFPKAPAPSKATIQMLMDSPQSSSIQVCSKLVDVTQKRLENSMLPFFEAQILSAEQVKNGVVIVEKQLLT